MPILLVTAKKVVLSSGKIWPFEGSSALKSSKANQRPVSSSACLADSRESVWPHMLRSGTPAEQ